jgi:feruloyl esterase
MKRRSVGQFLAVLLTIGALVAFPAAASALTTHPPTPGQAAPAAPIKPVTDCSALAGRSLPDTQATVTSAKLVTKPLGTKAVPFCAITGVFAPHTTFGMLLPADTWHGQYVQEGCSGLCGTVQLSEFPQAGVTCSAVGDGELAYAADDEGNTSGPDSGQWAQHSLQARIVYGVTSENSMEHVARTLLTTYYGQPPAYSYFDGCSEGGREALMLAQRYPDDFNGIIAGSPGMNMAPQFALLYAWLADSNTAPDGHQILTAENLPALHAAVLRSCGNAQGVITDPRQCSFNPASIQCPPDTQSDSCLTPAQVSAVAKFYRGPTDQQGQSLYNGGEPYGSELGWAYASFVMPAANPNAPADSLAAQSALNYLNYLAFWPNPPRELTLADVPFTAEEFHRLDLLGDPLYNANNPDLRAFAAHGGKLIIYHGWADQDIPPWSTLDYYRAAERAAGGYRASQSFSRLYMIPGAYHCLIGPDEQTDTIADFLSPLIAWTQHGTAPGAVSAPTWSKPQNKIITDLTVQPYDALAPITPANGSLNGNYHYIGSY